MIDKKRWSKKHTKIATTIGLVLVIVILLVLKFVSPESKLKRIGYSKYDISVIKDGVSKENIDKLIDMEYIPIIANFIEDKDYNKDNIIKYINYFLKHKSVTLKDIVTIVNGEAEDYEYSEFLIECIRDENYNHLYVDRYITYHDEYKDAPAHETVILVNNEIEKPYTESLGKLLNEDYFIVDNTERYINYSENHPNTSSKDVIAIVNSYTDYNQYSINNTIDFSKGNKVLVNKYHMLTSTYNNPTATTLDKRYAEENIKLDKTVTAHLTEMLDVAKENGFDIIVKRGYLNYTELSNLYYSLSKTNGEWYADSYLGKPGSSEFQTSYAVGLAVRGDSMENFGNTAAFKWINDNAYKFGFILRYPQGKEYVTGFAYMPWHFRYVGKDAAVNIKETGLSYEEYYAYYIGHNK